MKGIVCDRAKERVTDLAGAAEFAEMNRGLGIPIVLTTGCYDVLHQGHVAFLERAGNLGRLVVGIGSDRTVSAIKGRGRPVQDEATRAAMVASIYCASCVFISRERPRGPERDDFSRALQAIRPDVFALVADDPHVARKRRIVEAAGAKLVLIPPTPGRKHRTTDIVRRLRQYR